MSEVFATAGEPVTTEDGKVICYVKNDLHRHALTAVEESFHQFSEGETPWRSGEKIDERCARWTKNGGLQICINGEWRP